MPGGSSYTNTFTGSIVEPRDVNYQALALSATPLQLFWPTSSQAAGTVCARINDVTPSGASQVALMPPANQASNGSDAIFRNIGANAFTVQDSTGATIISVPVGIAVYLYLKDNTTAGGTWGVITFGAGTSANDATSLAGLGLKAISTTLNQAHPVSDITVAPTINAASRAQLYAWQSGVGSVTLPSTASVGSDFFFLFKNNGTGNFTITAGGTDIIDNAASISIASNESCIIFSDGATPGKWYTVGLGRNVNFAFSLLVKNVAGNVDVTLTATEASNKLITLTGVLTGSINVIVPNTASPYFIYNNTTGAFIITIKTAAGTGVTVAQATRSILTCDAINVYNAQTNTVVSTTFNAGTAASPSVTFVGSLDTGLFLPAVKQVGISGGGVLVILADGTVATPVNYLQVSSSATLTPVLITAQGTDVNIGLQLKPKGTGTIALADSSGKAVVTALGVATAVNGLQVTNSATGTPVLVAPIGTDANIGITITPKGTGVLILADTNSKNIITAAGVNLAVNGLQITNSVTLSPVLIAPTGTDANIGVTITPKGTGVITIAGPLTVTGLASVATLTTVDNTFSIVGSGDATKIWKLEVDGITPGTTRTGTVPDYDIRLGNLPAGIGPIPYAGSVVPIGWLACDGSAVSRATYAALFAAIGTTWGIGDGATTFNLPDMRGRVPVGDGTGTVFEACTASSANGFTVVSNATKWETGQPVVLSNLAGFVTTATAGPTYFVVRVSATNIRLATTLALAQNLTPDITISGAGTVTVTGTLTARTLGQNGGEEAHAMSSTEDLAHVHVENSYAGGGATFAAGGRSDGGALTSAGPSTLSFGGNTAMNIMQPFIITKYIISY